MDNVIQSKLHLFSVGIVAVDKPLTSFDIEVNCIETNHLHNDYLDDTEKTEKITSKDGRGTPVPLEIKRDQIIKAQWLAKGTCGNRVTAPDVRQGEHVFVYRYADTDEYYWEKVYTEGEIRRLERVLWMFGGTDTKGELNTIENSYWMLMSTIDKRMHLHSSVSNGEPFEWDAKIDTGKGILTVTENSGIELEMSAPDAKTTLESRRKIHLKTNIFQITARRVIHGCGGGGVKFGAANNARGMGYTPSEHIPQGGISGKSSGASQRGFAKMSFSIAKGVSAAGAYSYRDYHFSNLDAEEEGGVDQDREYEITNDKGIEITYFDDTDCIETLVENEIYEQSKTNIRKGKVSITDSAPLIESKSDTKVIETLVLDITGHEYVEIIGASHVKISSDARIILDAPLVTVTNNLEVGGHISAASIGAGGGGFDTGGNMVASSIEVAGKASVYGDVVAGGNISASGTVTGSNI